MWGYFFGSTKKIPPHNLYFTAIPKDPVDAIVRGGYNKITLHTLKTTTIPKAPNSCEEE